MVTERGPAARGMLRPGLLVSPASSMPWRNPKNANAIDAMGIASKTPCKPNGANPPKPVKWVG